MIIGFAAASHKEHQLERNKFYNFYVVALASVDHPVNCQPKEDVGF